MTSLKSRVLDYYEKNETKVDIAFFMGGFIFDVFTLSDIDDPFSISQQIVYLFVAGMILYFEFLVPLNIVKVPPKLEKLWNFRQLAFHFILGSLLSVYSLFFLKSSSFFTSMIFVLFIMALMIVNEMKRVQQSEVNIKIGLYVICLFSFFSMMFPVLLGFVGIVSFALSLVFTALVLFGVYKILLRKVQDENILLRRLTAPASVVLILFFLFYLMGWIPPVPLSVKNIGVYHQIEKTNGTYVVSHERPWWKFWKTGDQDFKARPGDKIFVFAEIFSPAKFSDVVKLHWYFKDPRAGWISTDPVDMKITGGRKGGYRGFSTKQNYSPGEWRVSVETTDRREIGRIYFDLELDAGTEERVFTKEIF